MVARIQWTPLPGLSDEPELGEALLKQREALLARADDLRKRRSAIDEQRALLTAKVPVVDVDVNADLKLVGQVRAEIYRVLVDEIVLREEVGAFLEARHLVFVALVEPAQIAWTAAQKTVIDWLLASGWDAPDDAPNPCAFRPDMVARNRSVYEARVRLHAMQDCAADAEQQRYNTQGLTAVQKQLAGLRERILTV